MALQPLPVAASPGISRARLTKFERSRLLAVRACQLTEGEKPLVEIPPHVRDPVAIATLELEKGCLGNFKVKRTLLDGTTQEWTVNELLL